MVELAISTNQKPMIYCNLYENTAPGDVFSYKVQVCRHSAVVHEDRLNTCRGDWGTLRRKNSNSPNTDLIFKIKYFDDTYGYSIQWGIFEQEMKIIRNV